MQSKRQIGDKGENIVLQDYLKRGYSLLQKNYTIRGGEIDLILTQDNKIIFVEIKVVNSTDDIFEYISKKKLNFVEKTIQYYIYENSIDQDIRLDAVFIKNGKIFETYENLNL